MALIQKPHLDRFYKKLMAKNKLSKNPWNPVLGCMYYQEINFHGWRSMVSIVLFIASNTVNHQ